MLIALSGIDGAGKSTQLELLEGHYRQRGLQTVYLWTRGGYTPGINRAKDVCRRLAGRKLPSSGNSPQREELLGKSWIQRVWLTIAILDLLRVYAFQVRLWLWQNKVVICDRYLWDTLIDFKIMFPGLPVENWLLWKMLVFCTPKPGLQCLLTITLELSDARCAQKFEPFPDSPERRERRYVLYREAKELERWKVLDSSRAIDAVFAEIRSLLP